MSDVLETIKSRRSIRKYKSDMVPQDKLEKIIEAGTYAATGMGKQSPITPLSHAAIPTSSGTARERRHMW